MSKIQLKLVLVLNLIILALVIVYFIRNRENFQDVSPPRCQGWQPGGVVDTKLDEKHRSCILSNDTYNNIQTCFENKGVNEDMRIFGSSGCGGIFSCVREAQLDNKCPVYAMSDDLNMCIKYAEKAVPENNSLIRSLGLCSSGYPDQEKCGRLNLHSGGPQRPNLNDFNSEVNFYKKCTGSGSTDLYKPVNPNTYIPTNDYNSYVSGLPNDGTRRLTGADQVTVVPTYQSYLPPPPRAISAERGLAGAVREVRR